MERRRCFTNTNGHLMVVFTEPEAKDYWLRPGESVELRAEVAFATDDFEVFDNLGGVTVAPSAGMGSIAAYAGGAELASGHQRPPGWF